VVTDDRRVESHLTTAAKNMLYYPIVYTILVLPVLATRFCTFSSTPVPFAATIATAAVFTLHGFVNTLLFCTTRNVLPGSWRQKLGLSTWGIRGQSSRTTGTWDGTWRSAFGHGLRSGTIGAGTAPVVLSVGVEKDVEIKYDDAESAHSSLRFVSPSSPTSPAPLLRAHGSGGQRVDAYIQRFSFATPRDTRTSIRIDKDNDLSSGDVRPASRAVEYEAPQHPGHATWGQENGSYRMAQAPSFIHPFGSATSPYNR
jgi:G protein-coupled glucose receptor regulating Gpa2 C-term